jgi:hypothetical protein
MTDVASKAANAVADTVKGAAKAVNPKQGEAAPMHGRTAIVTGRLNRLLTVPASCVLTRCSSGPTCPFLSIVLRVHCRVCMHHKLQEFTVAVPVP